MILFEFDHERAETLDQAAALLARHGARAKALAGGTDLLPNMRIEVTRPEVVVSLAGITPEPPRREADGSIRLDALSRLSALENDDFVREALPMVAEAAHKVAGNQIRQMGTLGGNLCQDTRCLYFNQKHDYQFVEPCYKRGGGCCYPYPTNKPDVCWSVFQSDTAPALLALDAQAEIRGSSGTRRAALAEVYSGSGLTPLALAPGELLAAVIVPPTPQRFGWAFHKAARRGGLEFGMAVVAVTVVLAEDGTCARARIAIGAVRERPLRAANAEALLVGKPLDAETIAAAANEAAAEANPLPHHGFTKSFLRDTIRVHVRRCLTQAAGRA